MRAYAQTNLQLYTQAIEAGWGDGDLATLRAAHDLAAALFSARFRSSGRPFLSHLVGTASILIAHGASASVAAAGLLHAAYMQGDFGGPGADRRGELRARVGDDVESLVHLYTAGGDPRVLLIVAANAFEEGLDFGCLYEGATRRNGAIRDLEEAIPIARAAGAPRLAEEITDLLSRMRVIQIPAPLRGDRNDSFTLAPRSYRRRLIPRLRRNLARLFRRRA